MMLVSFVVSLLAQNPCHSIGDCQTCISTPSADCGWCAVNTTFPTTVGPQCVDLHETFNCDKSFQTDTCAPGWKCESQGNVSQCVQSLGGIPDKTECEAGCKKPPPPPPPPPTQPYKCDNKTFTCSPAPFGDPSQQVCQDHCKLSWQCDEPAKMCKQVGPDAPGKKYDDNATCASVCPPTPQPTPPEIRGIWRGITIHKAYLPGEWVANITANYLTIWYPTPTGWELFCEGAASAIAHGAAQTYIITVSSTAGKIKGAIRFLAADYSMDPEMTSFLQLAVKEELPSTEVSDFDTAMTTATVISLETCPSGGTPPVPPPPPPGPPPPCKAKLDVMIVLDGSASIQPPDWQKALSFTNQVIDGFSISKDEVEIGIVQFSSISTLEIGLSPDKAAIQAIVTNLPQMMSNTDTYAGFETAQTEIRAHRRPNTNGTLVIILTDGKQNQGQPASVITDQLKTVDKAEIFGIGVGPDIDEVELQSWCSTPLPQHYFKVDDWSDLHKIIDQIVANACPQPHPPSSPHPPLRQHGDYCRFHLPSPLPVTVQRAAVSAEAAVRVLDEIDEINATDEKKPPRRKLQRTLAKDGLAPSDPCNPYANCSSCIAARPAFGQTCGWCSGDLKYSGETNVSKFKCAGKDQGNSSAKFTCSGNFQTTSCEVPGDCGLKGVYRGLRVDRNYTFGEWQAVFTPQTLAPNGTATGEFVKIDQLDMSGKVTSTIDGKIECTTKCTFADTIEGAPFKITASSGKIYYGICGYTHQYQAETDGLMWAVSDAGSTQAPKNFDVAMNSSNATVYTYYKCSEYKGATCQFKAV